MPGFTPGQRRRPVTMAQHATRELLSSCRAVICCSPCPHPRTTTALESRKRHPGAPGTSPRMDHTGHHLQRQASNTIRCWAARGEVMGRPHSTHIKGGQVPAPCARHGVLPAQHTKPIPNHPTHLHPPTAIVLGTHGQGDGAVHVLSPRGLSGCPCHQVEHRHVHGGSVLAGIHSDEQLPRRRHVCHGDRLIKGNNGPYQPRLERQQTQPHPLTCG
mmetsp:Transcript_24836/g.69212  ORF Transcript_24836/g.69212 Transcript_24836/m.69212 type:complete len:216 (-) Transcript_24836:397-1044(-)